MAQAGGFILDDLSHFTEPTRDVDGAEALPEPASLSLATPQPLSAKQEARLRDYLDSALLALSRGYRKRFDPNSPFPSLIAYLQEWNKLIGVLARVPPYGAGSTNLLLSYLLRCSNEIADGIRGYSLHMETDRLRRSLKKSRTDTSSSKEGKKQADQADATSQDEGEESTDDQDQVTELYNKQLNYALETLDLLDRIWSAILRGHMINFSTARDNAHRAFSNDSDDSAAPFRSRYDATMFTQGSNRSTSSLVPSPALNGRFSSSAAHRPTSIHESIPIQGGKGPKTVGLTDRVRLRNIVVIARQELFSWMRKELEAPPPPLLDGESDDDADRLDNKLKAGTEAEVKEEEGAQTENDQVAEDDQGDDEGDFEDVDIQSSAQKEAYDPSQDTEEHRHFQDLFDRKIDPDADDSDDDEGDEQAKPRQEEVPSNPRKREHSPAQRDDTKNQRTKFEVATPSQSELGSIEQSTRGDSIVQWDLAFTRLFSKTLRTLSDLADAPQKSSAASVAFSVSISGATGPGEDNANDEE